MSQVSFNITCGLQGTQQVRKAVNPTNYLAGIRKVNVRVEIDFPHGTEHFSGDDILDMSLLEEASFIGDTPMGAVSSNELSISLNNESRRFSPRDLSNHIFYGSPANIFSKPSNYVWEPKVDNFYYVDYWVYSPSGTSYAEWEEHAFEGHTIAVTSGHDQEITFDDFWMYITGWYWYSFWENFGPVTFAPFERKIFTLNFGHYSGGEQFPKLFNYFYLEFAKDWVTNFEFTIAKIEVLDEHGNNTLTKIPTLYPGSADRLPFRAYYSMYPSEYYEDPDQPLQTKPGLKMRPFVQITDADQAHDEVALGTFWCGEWDTPTNSLEARTTGYDRLMSILTVDTPQIPVMINTTIGQMFARLFRALGLDWTEYIISPALSQSIKVGWFPRDKVGQSLQLLAEAGNCYINVNRNNQIVVMPNTKAGQPSKLYTENDSIFSVNNPQKFLDIYTAVKVVYRLPYLKDPDNTLIRVDNIMIPPGTTTLDRIDFKPDDTPIMQVDWVYLYGDYNLPEIYNLYLGDSTGGTFKLGKVVIPEEDFVQSSVAEITFQGINTVTGEGEGSYTPPEEDIIWSSSIAYDIDAESLQGILESLYGFSSINVSKHNEVFTITFPLNEGKNYLRSDFSGLTGETDPYLLVNQEYVPPMNSKIINGGISYGATDITLTIENSGNTTEYINIEVKGVGTGFHNSHRVALKEDLIAEYGHKELPLDNPLIQDRSLAQSYSEFILEYVSDPLNRFELDLRGDPTLEVGSIVAISSLVDEIDYTRIVAKTIRSTYIPGYRSNVSSRRAL